MEVEGMNEARDTSTPHPVRQQWTVVDSEAPAGRDIVAKLLESGFKIHQAFSHNGHVWFLLLKDPTVELTTEFVPSDETYTYEQGAEPVSTEAPTTHDWGTRRAAEARVRRLEASLADYIRRLAKYEQVCGTCGGTGSSITERSIGKFDGSACSTCKGTGIVSWVRKLVDEMTHRAVATHSVHHEIRTFEHCIWKTCRELREALALISDEYRRIG